MDKAKVGKGSSLTSVFQQTEFTLGVIIVALFVITSVCTDNFFSVYNITNLMKQCAIIGVQALISAAAPSPAVLVWYWHCFSAIRG